MSYILVSESHPWRRTASFVAATLSIIGILGASGGVWMILNDKTANGIVASSIGLVFLACAFVITNIVRMSAQHDAAADRQNELDTINRKFDDVCKYRIDCEERIYRHIDEMKSEMESDFTTQRDGLYREIERLRDQIDSMKTKR